jgi:hypothetical protein
MMHIAHAVSVAMFAPSGASPQAGVHCAAHDELGSARGAKNTNSNQAGSIVKNLGG